jgi:hypothetical protein
LELFIESPLRLVHSLTANAPERMRVHLTVSDYSMSSGWFPVSTAPRDGTPVVLWMVEDEMPPALPLIGGYWTVNTATGLGGWRIFGAAEGQPFRVDEQIQGWKPLLGDQNHCAVLHAAVEP